MGVFEMVVAVVLISAVGRVAQTFARRSRGTDAATAERIQKLEADLRASELRLSQAEEKVAELDEKLGFVENLLAAPGRASQLPPGATGT